MGKRWFFILAAGYISILLLASCGTTSRGGTTSQGSASSGNEIHMNDTNFVQTSVTIKKGEGITLITDTLTPHIIANGSWENGSAKSAREPGAPEVKSLQVNGNSSMPIGPFNTAGTFKLYCTIHSGMNLTAVVQ